MNTVLIVDDSVIDRRRAGGLIERDHDCRAVYADDGEQALLRIGEEPPDVVVTDLTMPGMSGLELIEALRRDHPDLPVVIMTSMGSEDTAVQALHQGAASYVPKRRLAADLLNTVRSVVSASRDTRSAGELRHCLNRQILSYTLRPQLPLILALANSLQEALADVWNCPKRELINVGIAVEEALTNAYYHGCLEVSSALRDSDYTAYSDLMDQRREQEPYIHRRILVEATFSQKRATFHIADDGPGFDPSQLPDPSDPASHDSVIGRGLVLIHTFMDGVTHNARGNEITMVKNRTRRTRGD